MDFPGTLTLSARLWIDVVLSLCSSLAAQGMQRILLVNGHGATPPPLQRQPTRPVMRSPAVRGWRR